MRVTRFLSLILVLVGGCGLFATKDDLISQTGNGGVGDPCDDGSDCRDTLACVENLCMPTGDKGEGDSCELTADCMESLYCNHKRECAPAGDSGDGQSCKTVADCEAGLICVIEGFSAVCRETGDKDKGETCGADKDCLAGLSCLDLGSGNLCTSAPPIDGDPLPPLPPFWPGATCPDEEGEAPLAIFDLPSEQVNDDFYRLPFPNDIRLEKDRVSMDGHPAPGTALEVDVITQYKDALEADMDGFSTNPVVYFRFTTPPSPKSSDVFLVNLETGDQVSSWRFSFSDGTVGKYICGVYVAVTPGIQEPLL
ncbi:MAG: hypothetical protein KC416_16435, partial [Myxococcales bacterium]|nr:hypothetical protein [Myxococcales bacterium]